MFYYSDEEFLTARKWVNSICPQHKLDFSIHIFIVNGFTFFKIDPSSGLYNIFIELFKFILNFMFSYHIRFLIAPSSTILIKPSFWAHNPVIWTERRKKYARYKLWRSGPVNNTAGFFDIVVLDQYSPSNELGVLAHHLADLCLYIHLVPIQRYFHLFHIWNWNKKKI